MEFVDKKEEEKRVERETLKQRKIIDLFESPLRLENRMFLCFCCFFIVFALFLFCGLVVLLFFY